MAKAEKVVPTGLSEKSRIYTVKKKEEELQGALEQAQEEARLQQEKARKDADQIMDDARGRVSDVEGEAFEEAAKGADSQVKEILDSKDSAMGTITKSAKSGRESAVKAGLTFILSE